MSANPSKLNKPDRRIGRLIWLGTLIANLIIISLATVVVLESRKNALAEAQRLTDNYAEILESNISGFVSKIDIALLNVIDEVADQERQGGVNVHKLQSFIVRQNAHIPESLGIRISSADGQIRYATSTMPVTPVNIADRPYFIELRDQPTAGLVISPPLMGRAVLRPVIVLARRISKADGSFAGVAHVSVPADYFIRSFARLDLGSQGNSGLWTRTNLIARYSKDDPAGANTGSSTPSAQLRQLLDSQKIEATYQAVSGVDGISRIYRFHKVEPYSLFLVVGLADADYLADWQHHSQRIGGLLLLFFLATGVFARLVHVSWQRRELAQLQLNDLNAALRQRNDEVEAARQQSELILASAGEGICGVDSQGKVTFINRAAQEMLGWEAHEIIGADLHALSHHHYSDNRPFPAETCPVFATLQDGDKRQVADGCYWRRDGTSFPVEYVVAAIVQEGRISGAVNAFRDVTERRRNEQELDDYRHKLEILVKERTAALMETEARASHLLASSAGGLYGIDRCGVITFVNPAACEMLGYRAEQMVGQPAHSLFHHSHADGTNYPGSACPSYLALVLGQRVRVDDEVYWHADGHPIAVIYATHPMEIDGQINGAVTSFIDVTEQRAAAEARERAVIAAENLAQARSDFVANMSHEIRTPLNGVLGFADIGHRNYQNSEKARSAFAKIIVSGKRLLGVINDILDFSKIEAGKLRIEQIPVSVLDIVNQTIEIVADRVSAKQLQLRVELAPDLPESCISDPLRMGQVLLNVLSNAIKFTEAGRVVLSVTRQNKALIFKVADTGIGIGEQQLGELFSPFHQADTSATRRFGGTGLGLAISKRIVELMGGHISVESTLGVGSTFTFALPFLLPADVTVEVLGHSLSCAEAGEKVLAGMSILVAEDEPINQALLEESLRLDGASVTLAGNGREAVELVTKHGGNAYDMVLMDLQMPEMDGYEASRRILALAPDLPIIAQTAHAFAEEREKCIAVGMRGHIAKPINPDELVQLILRHTGQRPKNEAS